MGEKKGVKGRHVPLESIVDKFYGESEKRLSSILKLCGEIDDAIIFIDEVGRASDGSSVGRQSGHKSR